MKRLNKKGFTMAELLIVVAIIAVLVAIAIPIFNAQLKKSKLATDTANVRAAYAEVVADKLADGAVVSVDISDDLQPSVVNGSTVTYDSSTKKIVVTLETGMDDSFGIDDDVTVTE